VGDASGMFPIDIATGSYNQAMIGQFDHAVADRGFSWRLGDILPTVLSAGEAAGELTAAGASLLDPSGVLQPVSCAAHRGRCRYRHGGDELGRASDGNVSAGTSIFAMVVLEHDLAAMHPELDL